jgi:hypothetical protein
MDRTEGANADHDTEGSTPAGRAGYFEANVNDIVLPAQALGYKFGELEITSRAGTRASVRPLRFGATKRRPSR